MTDFISLPKLPANLSDIAVSSEERLRRTLNSKKNQTRSKETDAEMHDACLQMESLFIHHLLKEMRATIHKSGFISGGRAEDLYTSMMDAEIAAKISKNGGIGLANMLLGQLGERPSQVEEEDSDAP
jgi:flagellar protein FlgJ